MSTDTVDCYILPAEPLPLLLPADCIADVVEYPEITALENVTANWMTGHVTWNNQRLSVMSYSALLDPTLNESKKRKSKKRRPHLVVLNPIPDAVRKAYTGIICYGDIEQVHIGSDVEFTALPEGVDKRYVDGVMQASEKQFIVPRLTALAVAFSYF